MELLTGSGLALAAGLNAYIPMLLMGLLARYTSLLTLPTNWAWLENCWALMVLAVLLAIEIVADKIPAVDHVNDIVQTLIRPAAGGIVFAAGSSSVTPATELPAFTGETIWPLVFGLLLALLTHLSKAGLRAGVNLTTAGVGAPVASTVEDVSAVALTLLAVILPILALVFAAVVIVIIVVMRRRRYRPHRLIT